MAARILIADDSVTIQKVVELTFSREDFVLIPARSGEEAIRKAKEARPDLMLIDLVMPDKNGYDVCRALREEPLLRGTPIILLAGAFEAFDRNEGLKVGANDFVTKPFESQSLISKVKQLLSSQAAPAVAEPPKPRPAAPVALVEERGIRPVVPAPLVAAPATAVPPVPAAPPAPPEPAPEPVFEVREGFLPESPAPVPPGGLIEEPPSLGPAHAQPTAAQAAPELQELSLDDLTAEEPMAGEVSSMDMARVEAAPSAAAAPALAPAPAGAPVPAAAHPPDETPPEPAEPIFELELGSAYPGAAQPAKAPPAPGEPAMPELDLDLLAAAPPAAPAYDFEPLELEPAGPPPPSVPGTEELLRDLESASGPPAFAEAVEPAAAAAAPFVPSAPSEPPEASLGLEALEASPLIAPAVSEASVARPPEPLAATARVDFPPVAPPAALSADAQAERLAAELAPYLAREIADRIVERIERVVWEVVPDLAEALIARELDRIKERAERRPPR